MRCTRCPTSLPCTQALPVRTLTPSASSCPLFRPLFPLLFRPLFLRVLCFVLYFLPCVFFESSYMAAQAPC